jgi:hypothetical protein
MGNRSLNIWACSIVPQQPKQINVFAEKNLPLKQLNRYFKNNLIRIVSLRNYSNLYVSAFKYYTGCHQICVISVLGEYGSQLCVTATAPSEL